MRDQHPSAAVLQGEIEQLRKENIVLSQGYSSYVSRHRMAEEALSASESRYRRLFETAKDGILILDADSGMIIDVNPFLINLLGYSKQQFTEKAIWEIGFLKDIVANKEKFIELQEREYVRYENLPLKTSEGYEINVEFVSNVYLVNSISVIQCNIRDITERKRAENRIRLSTKILNLVNSDAPFNETMGQILTSIKQTLAFDAVGIRLKNGHDFPFYIQNGFSNDFLSTENNLFSESGNIAEISSNNGTPKLECTCGLVLTGYTDEAKQMFTAGGSFWTNNSSVLLDLGSKNDPRHNPRNRCIHEGFKSFALIPIHQNGKTEGLLQLNCINKNRFNPVIINFLESITETIGVALTRKQKEEALSKSEALYRDLVEKSNDGVYKSTHDGRFIEVNTAMVNILGYKTKAELMEVSIASLQDFDLNDQQSQPLNELPEGIGSYRLHKKDGSTIWVEDHMSYDLDDAGNIQYHRGIIRDVTERIMAQEKIKELNETLEVRIAERTAQLESTNKKLEFHNQEIEQYSYIINHDLQEPLRTLIQFTSILSNEYARSMDEDGKKYLDFIHNSALRMKELVMDLREYSGLGKTGEKTTIDCNIIVTHVLNDLGDAIHGSNALINVERLPVLIGFETEIRLLFQNLINNAIKFHKKEKRPVIGISAKSHEKEWIFKVSDNGIGIDPKYKDRIFTIFQRLHKRTDYEGTGIGLAHCKKIVELHGGAICVDSTIGTGSIFTFTIPKYPA